MWEYLTLFVLAATPLAELLVAIPLGLAYGLPPVPVALVTFLGNTLPILALIGLYERWSAGSRGRIRSAEEPGREAAVRPTARRKRAQHLWARYGIPGLALLAPLVTGAYVAAVAALGLGSPRRALGGWLTLSILLWTVGWTAAVHFGFEGARYFIEQ